ncbi:hypothetical protein [Streptomyces sp. G-G2]|uniref:hypothetical protein n=1 Tax=Streptomyces sp. G-G2 TaxID=3046201 RepID=UPI0024BA97B4|nr:hypothetical protein [Streptomyces sp. G-G2]MDJ0380319.1 hypothetical protein [Streptomyces sp. G-G2]
METVLNLLLIRFAVVVGGLVVLALVVFAIALALKRRGKGELDAVRRRATPLAREAGRLLTRRALSRGRQGLGGRGGERGRERGRGRGARW